MPQIMHFTSGYLKLGISNLYYYMQRSDLLVELVRLRRAMSGGRLCCCGGLTAPYYSHCWPGPAATATSHHSRTRETSYSSLRGHPLPRLPRPRVVPFLGLAFVHRRGAIGAAWSMWSRNDFHRKSTVVERLTVGSTTAARKCLLITRKIIIPPPDSWDPPEGLCIS